jgi:hypothetical protein
MRSSIAGIDRANQRPRANAHSGFHKPIASNAACNPPISSVKDIHKPIHSRALSHRNPRGAIFSEQAVKSDGEPG